MKFMKRIVGALIIVTVLVLSSCNKDEGLPKSGVSFELPEAGYDEVLESDGTLESFSPIDIEGGTGRVIEAKIVLNRAAAANIAIAYSITGTADINTTANPFGDFDIDGSVGVVVINEGESEAIIPITLYEDYAFEIDDDNQIYETIILTLESVISGPATIGENNIYALVVYEDDTYVFLEWDPQDDPGEDGGDVDMDIFLWLDGEFLGGSASKDTQPEIINIPAGFPDGAYEISYTYYDGTSNDLDFSVELFNAGGTFNNTSEYLKNYTKTYTLTNKNTYASDGEFPDVLKAQSMTKSEYDYINLTDITVAGSSSRIGSAHRSQKLSLPSNKNTMLKLKAMQNTQLKRLRK